MNEHCTYILGAGSIGLLLAAHLPGARLILRPGARATASLDLHRDGEHRRLAVPGLPPERLTRPVRRLIVCTKAYDVLSALQGLGGRLAADARLLLLQNGMGSQQAVAEALPGCSVYAASATEGAYRPAPAEVVHAARGLTRIGRLQGAETDWVELFSRGGLTAEPADPILWHLANKLRVNALINPLTALRACRNGELLEDPASLAWMRRLGAEADRVLAAAGWEYPEPAFEQACAVARSTAANWSSMYQDAQAGRRLELGYINGYLVGLGARLGVAVPEHEGLVARLGRRYAI